MSRVPAGEASCAAASGLSMVPRRALSSPPRFHEMIEMFESMQSLRLSQAAARRVTARLLPFRKHRHACDSRQPMRADSDGYYPERSVFTT